MCRLLPSLPQPALPGEATIDLPCAAKANRPSFIRSVLPTVRVAATRTPRSVPSALRPAGWPSMVTFVPAKPLACPMKALRTPWERRTGCVLYLTRNYGLSSCSCRVPSRAGVSVDLGLSSRVIWRVWRHLAPVCGAISEFWCADCTLPTVN